MGRRRKVKTRKVTHYQVVADGKDGERHPIGEPTTVMAEGWALYRMVRDPTRRLPRDTLGRPLSLLSYDVEVTDG